MQPKRLSDFEVADLFGIPTGWDLKECNNRLVTYIDRARVLRQAYEMKKSLSEVQLTDRTSVVVTEKTNVIFDAITKLKSMRAEAARRRLEVEQKRKAAMEETERNERRYKTQVEILIFYSDVYVWSPDDSAEGEDVIIGCSRPRGGKLEVQRVQQLQPERLLPWRPHGVYSVSILLLILALCLGSTINNLQGTSCSCRWEA